MRRILFAAVAAALLAIPALAVAHEEDHARAVDHIACGDGTTLTPPFQSPVCGGHGDIESLTCVSGAVLTPPLDGKSCPTAEEKQSADDESSDGGEYEKSVDGEPRKAKKKQVKPRFKAAFLHRVWRISGEANGYEAGVLDFTALDFFKLPRKWASQDDAVVGEDTRVLVDAKTRVYDADHHRVTGAAIATALDEALDVTVTAKILAYAKWQKDEDDIPVPTLRAKRIVIED